MREGALRKALCIVLSLTMVLTLFIAVAGIKEVSAKETQKSLQKKIDNAQDQIDENNETKAENNAKMKKIQSQIDASQEEVDALESEVKKANDKLEAAAQELEKGNKDLSSRLRTMYKSGSLGLVDVMLSSDNISDLFNNFSMVQYLFKSDKDVVAKLKTKHDALNDVAKTLTAKQTELNKKQEELDASYEKLASLNKEINSENSSLEDKIDTWRADSAKIAAMIKKNSSSSSSGGSSSGGGGYTPSPSESGQGFGYPCSGRISRGFGAFNAKWDTVPHLGLDIAVSTGTPIHASKAGKVIYAGWLGGYGNFVLIDHGNGMSTGYAHNSRIAVSVGQKVSKAQVVAYAGSTGNSSGPHCHFEIRVNGTPVNPLNYL